MYWYSDAMDVFFTWELTFSVYVLGSVANWMKKGASLGELLRHFVGSKNWVFPPWKTNSSPLKIDSSRRFLFETTIFRGENASFRQGKFETSIPFDVTFRNQKPKNWIGSSFRQGPFSVWKTSHILVWYDPIIFFATWQDFWTCNFTI